MITVWRVSVQTVVRAVRFKWQNSDPCNSKTLKDIKMRFGTRDYVVEMIPQVNLGAAPPEGAAPKGVKYTVFGKLFIHSFIHSFIHFFPTAHHRRRTYEYNGSKHEFWCKEVPLRGQIVS